jgi:hypothetical protein
MFRLFMAAEGIPLPRMAWHCPPDRPWLAFRALLVLPALLPLPAMLPFRALLAFPGFGYTPGGTAPKVAVNAVVKVQAAPLLSPAGALRELRLP